MVRFHCFNFVQWQRTRDKKLIRILILSGSPGEGNSEYPEASEHKPSNPHYFSVAFSVHSEEASIVASGPR
jgi:hypothetical protein